MHAALWRRLATLLRCRPRSALELHECGETEDREEVMRKHLSLLSQTTTDWQTLRHSRDSELSSNN